MTYKTIDYQLNTEPNNTVKISEKALMFSNIIFQSTHSIERTIELSEELPKIVGNILIDGYELGSASEKEVKDIVTLALAFNDAIVYKDCKNAKEIEGLLFDIHFKYYGGYVRPNIDTICR